MFTCGFAYMNKLGNRTITGNKFLMEWEMPSL